MFYTPGKQSLFFLCSGFPFSPWCTSSRKEMLERSCTAWWQYGGSGLVKPHLWGFFFSLLPSFFSCTFFQRDSVDFLCTILLLKSLEGEVLRKYFFKVLAMTKSWVTSNTVFTILAGGVDMTMDEWWERWVTGKDSAGHRTPAEHLPLCISFVFYLLSSLLLLRDWRQLAHPCKFACRLLILGKHCCFCRINTIYYYLNHFLVHM